MSALHRIPVVIRSHNDLHYLQETIAMVLKQRSPVDIQVFDNDSTDGSVEFLKEQPVTIHRVPTGTYIPGAVLNRAMESVDPLAPFVVFLNSDCTPLDDRWLDRLLAGFSEDSVAAVFGRQLPRPGCKLLFAKDTEDTFGDGSRQQYWRHCFSMASSAIRRSVWVEMPFRTDLSFSEDIDWTWRARQAGHRIIYAKDSKVFHSHNYTLGQFKRRQYGEGYAEAHIFSWTSWDKSFLRYSILPFLRQIKSDWTFSIKHGKPSGIWHSPLLRGAQMIGRRRGFVAGMKERADNE